MNYYIVEQSTGRILTILSSPPSIPELQSIANLMESEVYVIQGQHFGMSAVPSSLMESGDG